MNLKIDLWRDKRFCGCRRSTRDEIKCLVRVVTCCRSNIKLYEDGQKWIKTIVLKMVSSL